MENTNNRFNKRLYRPITLKTICVLYCALPLLYWTFFVVSGMANLYLLNNVNGMYGIFGIILVLLAPIVGLGLFTITRQGYFLFFLHSAMTLTYSLWRLPRGPIFTQFVAVIINVALLAAAIYLLRGNRRIVYMAHEIRGFRRVRRA